MHVTNLSMKELRKTSHPPLMSLLGGGGGVRGNFTNSGVTGRRGEVISYRALNLYILRIMYRYLLFRLFLELFAVVKLFEEQSRQGKPSVSYHSALMFSSHNIMSAVFSHATATVNKA